MLAEVETRVTQSNSNTIGTRLRQSADAPDAAAVPGNGVTAGRTEPGNRAHTFRMTLVAQGKLPQIIFLVYFSFSEQNI